jgi:uncharacterized protein (DUF488 family)
MRAPDEFFMRAVYSIGHSTRSLEELIALLAQHEIALLADVRRYPASRRHPQFNRAALEAALPAAGIAYVWIEALGGRRSPHKDSHNRAWHNAGFRGYADYMETQAFGHAVGQLTAYAQERRTAVMCAEQAWQQCHRGLIADFLKASGIDVVHITGDGRTQDHPWTAAARIVDGKLSYSAPTDSDQGALDF